MTFLPVVNRELRVASRERNTYRIRFVAALIPIVFCIFSLWIVTLLREEPIPGRNLFQILTWIEFIFVSICGFCLTADSLAEEKRENTLGLLFLTDLKGYDVVLGKIAGAGLRGLYAMMATFPVLGLPIMMGGSSPGEFGRSALVLFLTLLISMCAGIFFSSLLRKTWTAAGLSAMFMLLVCGVLPAYSELVRRTYNWPELAHALEICSPTYAFLMSFEGGWGMPSSAFGMSILVIFLTSLALLGVTSLIAPVVWKDRPPKKRMARVLQLKSRLIYGSVAFRRRFRTRLFAINPVYWLTRRERVTSIGFLTMVGLFGGIVYFLNRIYQHWNFLGTKGEIVFPFVTWMFFAGTVHILLIFRIAIVAAEKFGEDRRSGALELLVSTPLKIQEVLAGQWLSLRRQFAGPVATAFFIHLWPVLWLSMLVTLMDYPFRTGTFTTMLRDVGRHLFSNGFYLNDWGNHFALLVMLFLVPLLICDWISVAWTSMWLSMRVKRAISAPVLSILLVHLPPWFIWAVTMTWLDYKKWVFDDEFSEVLFGALLVIFYILGNQLFWMRLSKWQLLKHFRTAATDRYQPPRKLRWWTMRVA
jgi:ABC-type Na+ efflux pump permease subunit